MNSNYKKIVFIGIIFEMILLVAMFFVYAWALSASSQSLPPLGWFFCFMYLVPLAWMIPMDIKIYESYMYGYPMSNAFKTAVVICCGIWPCIFLFFDK